jgi:hypothetical protein
MANGFALDDYVPVAERIVRFYAAYPDGRIDTTAPRVVEIDGRTFLEVRATVYRNADTLRGTQATAWEPFPGATPYTKNSEAMNAETSAVGRALGLAGIEVHRSVASSDEIQARRPAPGIGKAEAKGRVMAAAVGDAGTARTVWALVFPDDPDTVDAGRLEAAEAVARHIAGLVQGDPEETADHAGGLAAARAVLAEAVD